MRANPQLVGYKLVIMITVA